MKKFTFSFALLVLASLIVIVLKFMPELSQPEVERDLRAQYLKAGDFLLEGPNGSYSLENFKGSPSIIYFGYTYCPDVCPVGLSVIRDAMQSSSKLKDVKTAFITLDPDRDTVKRLSEYTAFFHSNIIGLTGSKDVIKNVAQAYGGFFKINEKSVSTNAYTVDHSAYYYVLAKDGTLMRVLDHNATAPEIAEILLSLL